MSDAPRSIVHDVFATATQDGIADLYAGWAARYDADNAAKGARLAPVAAGFVARHVPKGTGPILDAACGTGLAGEALSILGYDRIEGFDVTPEMLEIARSRGVYDRLGVQRLPGPLDLPENHYAAILCLGAFGPGHAPPESLPALLRHARPGGVLVFNLVAASWQAQGFPAVLDRLEREGHWRLEERSAPFAPYPVGEPDLKSLLFVYRRR